MAMPLVKHFSLPPRFLHWLHRACSVWVAVGGSVIRGQGSQHRLRILNSQRRAFALAVLPPQVAFSWDADGREPPGEEQQQGEEGAAQAAGTVQGSGRAW